MASGSTNRIRTSDLPVYPGVVLASEAAVILGNSRQYVHQCVADGKLTAFNLSGYVALMKDEVLAFKADREAQAREAQEAREPEAVAAA